MFVPSCKKRPVSRVASECSVLRLFYGVCCHLGEISKLFPGTLCFELLSSLLFGLVASVPGSMDTLTHNGMTHDFKHLRVFKGYTQPMAHLNAGCSWEDQAGSCSPTGRLRTELRFSMN
eukprot:1845762-Amphidinium_carterae.1